MGNEVISREILFHSLDINKWASGSSRMSADNSNNNIVIMKATDIY